jgi:hypothetical protein
MPVLPGKHDALMKFTAALNGARRDEVVASRKALGITERTFVQPTPHGDVIIVTADGEDPAGEFARFGEATDDFTDRFVDQVKEIHGVDLREPLPGPLPEMIVTS